MVGAGISLTILILCLLLSVPEDSIGRVSIKEASEGQLSQVFLNVLDDASDGCEFGGVQSVNDAQDAEVVVVAGPSLVSELPPVPKLHHDRGQVGMSAAVCVA